MAQIVLLVSEHFPPKGPVFRRMPKYRAFLHIMTILIGLS